MENREPNRRYAIEHISKLGNVVVRAGCGEFDGERNVYVDVGLSQVDREY